MLEPTQPRGIGLPRLTLGFELLTQPELELAGRLVAKRDRENLIDLGTPGRKHVDDPSHQLARLPRTRGCLDHERLVQR